MAIITIESIVVPRSHPDKWMVGRVMETSRHDLSIGPVLHITDLITGQKVEMLPMHVALIVRSDRKVTICSLVTPKDSGEDWEFGKVIGVLSIDQPDERLLIMDITNRRKFERLRSSVERLTRMA